MMEDEYAYAAQLVFEEKKEERPEEGHKLK